MYDNHIRDIITISTRIGLGSENCLYVNDLSAMIDNKSSVDITVREFVKMVFDELGIEVEFSGRNEHEKGVIIDVDEDKVIRLGLSSDVLKFGQTIVRIGDAKNKAMVIIPHSDITFDPGEEPNWTRSFDWDKLINELIAQILGNKK